MDGLLAERSHVTAAASCLHENKEFVTITRDEASKQLYPLCDFNLLRGVKHTTLAQNTDGFYFCSNCFAVLCANCNMTSPQSLRFNSILLLAMDSNILIAIRAIVYSIIGTIDTSLL